MDFRNTVIIMTSNLASEFLASKGGAVGFVSKDDAGNGFGSEMALRDRVLGRLRESMQPEFLRKLDQPQLRLVQRQLLGQTQARQQSQSCFLDRRMPTRSLVSKEPQNSIEEIICIFDGYTARFVLASESGESLPLPANPGRGCRLTSSAGRKPRFGKISLGEI